MSELVWTNVPPKSSGFWFVRFYDGTAMVADIVDIRLNAKGDLYLFLDENETTIEEKFVNPAKKVGLEIEWAGPIPLPLEKN